jgi:hypothetical protein
LISAPLSKSILQVCESMNPVATRSPRRGVSKADERLVLSRCVFITRSEGGGADCGN